MPYFPEFGKIVPENVVRIGSRRWFFGFPKALDEPIQGNNA